MLKQIQISKRISIIGVISVSLAACGVGTSGTTRAAVDPNGAYGIVQGAAVPYTGPLLAAYTPTVLQGVINTSPAVTSLLGFNGFGVCNGLASTSGSQMLCQVNQAAINGNPSFSTIFPNGGAAVNVGNFVVAGATALGIKVIQPYRIMYSTAGAPYQFAGGATNPQTVSAAVLVPQIAPGVPLPAAQIKGVLLFYHGTDLSKGGVPSDFDGTLTPNNSPSAIQANAGTAYALDATLAAVFATQGYVVVAPDYVGQGVNYQVQHPYVVFPQTNAQSGLNALSAARTALAAQGVMLPSPAKLYISSYSEGGSYALWASQLAQTTYASFLSNNGFVLRRTIGVSGAYDLTGATLNYEFANASNSLNPAVNTWNVSPGIIPSSSLITPAVQAAARVVAATNLAVSKTSLAGYFLTTLAYYNSSSAAVNVLAPNYSPMNACVNWDVINSTGTYPGTAANPGTVTPQSTFTSCPLALNVIGTYNTSGLTETQVANQSFAAAAASSIGPNAFFTGGQTYTNLTTSLATGYTNNSVGSFVEPGVLNDPTITPFLAQQNIQSMATNSPTDLLFLDYDSTVSNINSLEACGNLPSSAQFPGFQPGYTGGMKQLSPAGMVNCINFANDGAGQFSQLFTQVGNVPIMVDHGQAIAVLQILTLNQITANP